MIDTFIDASVAMHFRRAVAKRKSRHRSLERREVFERGRSPRGDVGSGPRTELRYNPTLFQSAGECSAALDTELWIPISLTAALLRRIV